jgi:chromosome segregation ATPase
MQNNFVVVDMSDSNIQYQVFVKDIEVEAVTDAPGSSVDASANADAGSSVDASADVEAVTDTPSVDKDTVNFITGASGKSRNGNLTQNKYQILANELSQELDNHKQMVTDKMASLEKSQKVILELQSVIAKQNSQINDHATKAQMHIETIKDLQKKIDVLSSEKGDSVSELQNENDNLNNEMMVLQSSILKLHQERDSRTVEMTQLQEQHQKLQDLLSSKVKELSLVQTENTNFKNQVELYKESNNSLQQELDTVKTTLSQLVVPVVTVDVSGDTAIESIESIEPGLDRVVGNVRVQRNVRRANPPRRR